MTNDIHPAKTNGHGDYERRDIGVRAVYYFLAGLVLALAVAYLAVNVFFSCPGEAFSSRSDTGEPISCDGSR